MSTQVWRKLTRSCASGPGRPVGVKRESGPEGTRGRLLLAPRRPVGGRDRLRTRTPTPFRPRGGAVGRRYAPKITDGKEAGFALRHLSHHVAESDRSDRLEHPTGGHHVGHPALLCPFADAPESPGHPRATSAMVGGSSLVAPGEVPWRRLPRDSLAFCNRRAEQTWGGRALSEPDGIALTRPLETRRPLTSSSEWFLRERQIHQREIGVASSFPLGPGRARPALCLRPDYEAGRWEPRILRCRPRHSMSSYVRRGRRDGVF